MSAPFIAPKRLLLYLHRDVGTGAFAMPQRKLDERYCATRKAADGAAQTDYFDAETTGLALRVF